MAHRVHGGAALSAACLTALLTAGTADAQSSRHLRRIDDCRYEPNRPLPPPYWIDQNGCLRMRQGSEDVFVTGSVGHVPSGNTGGGPGRRPDGGRGRDGSGVSPVTDGPGGGAPRADNPRGGSPRADNPRDNPRGGSPRGDDPRGDAPKGGSPKGDTPGGGRGRDRDGKNNNGLGNGWDPGDSDGSRSYQPNDPDTDLKRGEDPSNPAHGDGSGGPGRSGDKGNAGGKGNAGDKGSAGDKGHDRK